ncbi:MAG: hypothetical protein KJ668_09440, partial [Proteobacteria bacterium]|nr:hypothetical protein [Pseudomonadota bacterium]
VNYDLIWPWELFLILIATGNIFFLYKTAPRKINVSSKDLSLVFIAAILCILVFQTSNQIMYLLKVANESRSTFIYGLELHHINYGILGAVFLPGLYRIFYFKKYMKPVLLILAGVFYGMIWDEWLYYMYKDVSDEAYMSHQTYLSAIFCVAVSYFCWLCFLEWTDTKNQT